MSEFSDKEYHAIEAAVLETERGRRFLAEYARRNRAADTETLLVAMRRLETAVVRQPSALAHVNRAETDSLLATIADTEAAIARIRNDLSEAAGPLEPGSDVFAQLTSLARQLAEEINAAGDALQALVDGEGTVDSKPVAAIVDRLQSIAITQDVLSQRVGKAMTVLAHVRNHLQREAADWVVADGGDLSQETLAFFAKDEHLFTDDEPADTQTAMQNEEPEAGEQPAPPDFPVASSEPPVAANDWAEASAGEAKPSKRAAPVPDLPGSGPAQELVSPVSEARSEPAGEAAVNADPVPSEALAEVPDGAVPISKADRDRIVIIRRGGAGGEIPLAGGLPETSASEAGKAG